MDFFPDKASIQYLSNYYLMSCFMDLYSSLYNSIFYIYLSTINEEVKDLNMKTF